MTERSFRIILGGLLLIGLYFDLAALVWGVIGIQAIQGITNWRILALVSRLHSGPRPQTSPCCTSSRFGLEAERVLSLVVALILIPSYGPWNPQLWIVPWFIGFALLGAGLSGLCPMVIGLKRLGLR